MKVYSRYQNSYETMHFDSNAERAAYLQTSLEQCGCDASAISKAIGNIARDYGLEQLAESTHLSLDTVYRCISGEHSPSFENVLKIIKVLGISLFAEAKHEDYLDARQTQRADFHPHVSRQSAN